MGKREACIKLGNLDVKKGRVTLKLRMHLAFYARDKVFYPRLEKRQQAYLGEK